MDLLEGALYGLDLLKLQSVTTKLLSRVNHMEKVLHTHTQTHTHVILMET